MVLELGVVARCFQFVLLLFVNVYVHFFLAFYKKFEHLGAAVSYFTIFFLALNRAFKKEDILSYLHYFRTSLVSENIILLDS